MIIIDAARAALEGNDSDDDSISGGDDTVHVALGIVTITLSIQEKEEHNNTRHGYKTAILSAFNALNQPDRDREKKKKKTLIAQLEELEPMAYIDREGKEHDL